MPDLTATNLKNALWETLKSIQNGKTQPGEGDAIACQAREILRTIRTQLQIAAQSKRDIPTTVIDFSEK